MPLISSKFNCGRFLIFCNVRNPHRHLAASGVAAVRIAAQHKSLRLGTLLDVQTRQGVALQVAQRDFHKLLAHAFEELFRARGLGHIWPL